MSFVSFLSLSVTRWPSQPSSSDQLPYSEWYQSPESITISTLINTHQ